MRAAWVVMPPSKSASSNGAFMADLLGCLWQSLARSRWLWRPQKKLLKISLASSTTFVIVNELA